MAPQAGGFMPVRPTGITPNISWQFFSIDEMGNGIRYRDAADGCLRRVRFVPMSEGLFGAGDAEKILGSHLDF
jgi:hypothetical protein